MTVRYALLRIVPVHTIQIQVIAHISYLRLARPYKYELIRFAPVGVTTRVSVKLCRIS